MTPLSLEGAKHFCAQFSKTATPPVDVRELYDTALVKRKSFKEGEQVFNEYRDALLREADRYFFLGVSCFRRALDLFSGASASWAHVSLYYSAWFAAHSVLGMFGCWVQAPRKIVEVKSHSPGSQEFEVAKKKYSTKSSGSHMFFWDAYYNAMQSMILWTDPSLHLAVKPISNNHTWAIERRNLVNYETLQAFKLMREHNAKFDATKFPSTLQGDLATQFQLTKSLLLFCADRAKEFGLKTDVYSTFGTRSTAIKKLIYKTTPSVLSNYSEESKLAV